MMTWKKLDASKQPVRFSQWSVRQGRVTVEIDSTTVNVTATGLSGRDHWSEPVSSFTGVFRHVANIAGLHGGAGLPRPVTRAASLAKQFFRRDAQDTIS
jgi:hypothetical protein